MARPDDLALLPPAIAERATVHSNGEVSWRIEDAAGAIVALGDAGLVVLGLDVRVYDEDGRFTEIAWSSYEPSGKDDPIGARSAALDALARPDVPGNVVLITWTE